MPVQHLGVVGAGTMGRGIAQVAALRSFRTALYDIEDRIVTAALAQVRADLDRQVGRGRLAPAAAEAALARLIPTPRLEDLAGCDLIVEAVPEDLDVKRNLFAALSRLAPEAILATNTSSLSVTALAAATARPEQVVGLHFFNPAPVMALVEVIPGKRTSAETVETSLAFAQALGKTPVRAKDTPGFIVNRVARPFYLEALRLVGEGRASVEEVDLTMRLAGGFRMGPFELLDLVGLDVNLAVTESIYEASGRPERFRPHPLQVQLVRDGRLGRKVGRGFYVYEQGERWAAAPPASPVRKPPTSGASKLVIVDGRGRLAEEFRAAARAAGWTVRTLVIRDSRGDAPPRSLREADALVEFHLDRSDKEALLKTVATALGADAVWISLVLTTSMTDPVRFLEQRLSGGDDGPRVHPRRIVGLATLPPWPERRLVEILPGRLSDPGAVAAAQDLFQALGKETAVVRAGIAGIFPRVLAMIVNEAALAVQEGVAAPADVDTAMRLGANYPQGPLALADEIGLDVFLTILEALRLESGEDRYRPADLLENLVAAGRTGRAAGRGFYAYGADAHG